MPLKRYSSFFKNGLFVNSTFLAYVMHVLSLSCYKSFVCYLICLAWLVWSLHLDAMHTDSYLIVCCFSCVCVFYSVTNNGKFINNEFNDVYLVTVLHPIPLDAFTLQVRLFPFYDVEVLKATQVTSPFRFVLVYIRKKKSLL